MAAWLLTASMGPLLSVVGANGWLTVLIAAVLCGALSFCVLTCGQRKLPRWLCVLELIWLTIFLGGMARQCETCWTEAVGFPAIPMIMLLLAPLAAQRGAIQAARTGATLMWLAIPVLGIVLLAGTADMNIRWVRPELEMPDSVLLSVLLIPCLGIFLPQKQTREIRRMIPAVAMVSIAASILMDAVMGQAVAKTANNTFYEFSKGISLFGVAERFEALVACALTAGWFALFTMLFSTAYHLAEQIFAPAAKWSVWFTAAVSTVLMCILPIDPHIMIVGSLIFWAFLPVTTQGIEKAKNIEKK